MSSFYCPTCGKSIIDSPKGYISGCKHYKIDKDTKNHSTSYSDTLMAIFGYKRAVVRRKK